MDLIQALKAAGPSGKIRRPIPKHSRSNRTGWLSTEYVISLLTSRSGWNYPSNYDENLINSVDLMADDWEYKNENT